MGVCMCVCLGGNQEERMSFSKDGCEISIYGEERGWQNRISVYEDERRRRRRKRRRRNRKRKSVSLCVVKDISLYGREQRGEEE